MVRTCSGSVHAASPLNTCMDLVLVRVADQSRCGTSVGDIKVTDIVFVVVALKVMILKVIHEEANPLGLKASWASNMLQSSGGFVLTQFNLFRHVRISR